MKIYRIMRFCRTAAFAVLASVTTIGPLGAQGLADYYIGYSGPSGPGITTLSEPQVFVTGAGVDPGALPGIGLSVQRLVRIGSEVSNAPGRAYTLTFDGPRVGPCINPPMGPDF
jgi:hypothetical protein